MSRPYHDEEARNRFEALIARLSSQPKKLDFDINAWLDEIKPLLQRSKRLKYRAILWNALMEHPPIKGTNPKWDAGVQRFLSVALDGLTKDSAKTPCISFPGYPP